VTIQPIGVACSATTARASMLRIADVWSELGQINQALDFYLRIIARYPGSPEAHEAEERSLAQAQAYERQGQFRLALSLYEKLEPHS